MRMLTAAEYGALTARAPTVLDRETFDALLARGLIVVHSRDEQHRYSSLTTLGSIAIRVYEEMYVKSEARVQ